MSKHTSTSRTKTKTSVPKQFLQIKKKARSRKK